MLLTSDTEINVTEHQRHIQCNTEILKLFHID